MSNIATKQFTPMNTNYAQLNQPSVQADKSLELSPSMDSMKKFLKDSGPAPKENSVPMNKESLEKLFTMFEFVVKAMRSMLAGMGVLPRQPGELDAQPRQPGTLDVLPLPPGLDIQTTVLPGTDAKVVPDAKAEQKVAPGTDTKPTVLPGTDAKVVPDAKAEQKVAPEADTKTLVKPGPEVKVMPDGRTQMTTSHDGKNILSSGINVTVQVQNHPCPHTTEKVTPQPPLMPALPVTPGLDTKPSPQPPLMPALDKQPSPQPPVSPGLDTNPSPQPPVTPPTPDLTCPAPDDLVDDFSGHSQTRFDNHRANRPSLRSRF